MSKIARPDHDIEELITKRWSPYAFDPRPVSRDDLCSLFEAARCFEKLGKSVEARNHFKQVGDRHPQTRWAKMASQRLSELSAAGMGGRP